MYIISKFKDYYDGAVGNSIDKSIVYERKERQIKKPKILLNTLGVESKYGWAEKRKTMATPSVESKYNNEYLKIVLIGFCGKIYVGLKVITVDADNLNNPIEIIDFIYDLKEIKSRIKFDKSKYSWRGTNELYFNNFVNRVTKTDSIEIFREFKTPIFAVGHYNSQRNDEKFYVNPKLKNYKFFKVFDTYTAFQEIQMFISGVLPTGDDVDTTEMSEKQKVEQHGFDKKYGFRKRPKV